MPTITTQIKIVDGTLICTPNQGHVRAGARAELVWHSADEEFTLAFAMLGGRKAWPFREAEPPVFKPTRHFAGTLKDVTTDPAPAYKYTVAIDGRQLDPIIIVDK